MRRGECNCHKHNKQTHILFLFSVFSFMFELSTGVKWHTITIFTIPLTFAKIRCIKCHKTYHKTYYVFRKNLFLSSKGWNEITLLLNWIQAWNLFKKLKNIDDRIKKCNFPFGLVWWAKKSKNLRQNNCLCILYEYDLKFKSIHIHITPKLNTMVQLQSSYEIEDGTMPFIILNARIAIFYWVTKQSIEKRRLLFLYKEGEQKKNAK